MNFEHFKIRRNLFIIIEVKEFDIILNIFSDANFVRGLEYYYEI